MIGAFSRVPSWEKSIRLEFLMRLFQGELLHSASDLSNFLSCEHLEAQIGRAHV